MKKAFSYFRKGFRTYSKISTANEDEFVRFFSKCAKLSIIGIALGFSSQKNILFADKKFAEELFEEQTSESDGKMVELVFEIPENITLATPNKIVIKDEKSGKTFNFLIHYADKPERCATGSVCTYDGKTDLSKGLLLNNKLVCPEHGCEFNIENGSVESGPAINDLPIYHVQSIEKNGQTFLKVFSPTLMPIALKPRLFTKSQKDFRKVLIIGCGAGAIGTAETLRKIGYTGDLMMFCESQSGPVQRRNFTKYTKLSGNESAIFLRDNEFWKKYDIDILNGKKVKKIEVLDDYGFVQLADNSKYYYDALVVSSGAGSANRKTESNYANNFVILETLDDFKKSEKLLRKSKVVAINNMNFQALELASSIIRDYPQAEIHFFVNKTTNHLLEEVGPVIYDNIVHAFRKRGAKFHTETNVNNFELDVQTNSIHKIEYGPSPKKTKFIHPDVVFNFPLNFQAKTEYIDFLKYNDELHVNNFRQLNVNSQQRTQIKFIFSTGSASGTSDYFSGANIVFPSFADSYYQGEIAAYNIQALKIPNHRTSFSFYNILGRTLQTIGTKNFFEEVYTEGNPTELNFLSYYTINNRIVYVAGTTEFSRELMLLKEALNSGKIISLKAIKSNRKEFFDRLTRDLASDRSTECIREKIFKKRYNFVEKSVFWQDSSTKNEIRSEEFKNFKPVEKS